MHRLRLAALTAALLLLGSPSLALDASDVPLPPTKLASTVEEEKDLEGSIKFYNGTLSWESRGNSTWLAAAEFTIEKRAVGTTEWKEHLPRRYYSTFDFTWGLGTLMFGNTYEVRIIERAGGFDTGYSEIIKVDVPMPTPEITKLETQPDPIPPGYADQIFMTVYGKHFQWDLFFPENKPARVLWDGEELPGFDAGHRIVSGWVAADRLSTGRHEIQVVQGGVTSNETLYLDIGDVGDVVEGVRATGDAKKRKVYLDWQKMDGADGYEIQRREVVAEPAPGAKALVYGDWAKIATVAGRVTKWKDRSVGNDQVFQYRVAAILADKTTDYSKEDTAWTPGRKPPGKVDFDAFTGRWSLKVDDVTDLGAVIVSTGPKGEIVFLYSVGSVFYLRFDIRVRGTGAISKSSFVALGAGGAVHPAFALQPDPKDPEKLTPYAVLGKALLWVEPGEPCSYRKLVGVLKPKATHPVGSKPIKKLRGAPDILIEATAAHDAEHHPPDTTLKITMGSSAGKKPVRPGQTVTIVTQVSCLGSPPSVEIASGSAYRYATDRSRLPARTVWGRSWASPRPAPSGSISESWDRPEEGRATSRELPSSRP